MIFKWFHRFLLKVIQIFIFVFHYADLGTPKEKEYQYWFAGVFDLRNSTPHLQIAKMKIPETLLKQVVKFKPKVSLVLKSKVGHLFFSNERNDLCVHFRSL